MYSKIEKSRIWWYH